MTPETASWTRRLAETIVAHPIGDYPPSAWRQAALVLADTVGAIAIGMQEAEPRRLAARFADPGAATLIGFGTGRPDDAAFMNGLAGSTVELDEGSYSGNGHPAIHSVPVALATGEAIGASGAAVLDGILLGYEVTCRIGRATRSHPAIHTNGTWGTIGGAVTIGRLRGFDGARMHQAMLIAASLGLATSGSSSAKGATARNVYPGVSARNAWLACDMAEDGFIGEEEAIAIAYGRVLGSAFDPEKAAADWGAFWEIERNFYKFTANCKETQGALTALEALMARDGAAAMAPAGLADLELEVFADAAGLTARQPANPLAARFSIPFALATRLVHGRTPITEAEVAAMLADLRVVALASIVSVREDPALTARAPAELVTRLRVRHADGAMRVIEVIGSLGDFDQPFDRGLLETKFAGLMDRIWPGRGAALWQSWSGIADLADIRPLMAELRTPPTASPS